MDEEREEYPTFCSYIGSSVFETLQKYILTSTCRSWSTLKEVEGDLHVAEKKFRSFFKMEYLPCCSSNMQHITSR